MSEVVSKSTEAVENEAVAAPLSPQEQAEARRYSAATLQVTLVDMALDMVVLVLIALAIGPAVDGWLAGFSTLAGEQSWLRVAALAAALTGIHSLISLPLSYYSGYTIEHKFGLSRQSRGAWAKSWVKRTLLTLVFLAALYTGLMAIVWLAGSWWWLAAAGMFFLVSAVLGQLAPVLIVPLFYEVKRIDDEATINRLASMASDAGLSLEGVYRLKLSQETSKANAMLAGLGSTRRVLLGDTLIDEFTDEETDVVFAHELGHHVHNHLPKMLAMAAIWAAAGFYLVHVALVEWTGVVDPAAWPPGVLPKLMLLLGVFSMLIGPVQNVISRHFERQADRYALDATKSPATFRSAFLKLARMNKADLEPHPWEVALLHSHPPISQRLAAAEANPPV